METVVEILMRRDGLTRSDANELVAETRDLIIKRPYEACEIIADQLSLEPDYLMEIVNFEG